MTKTLKQPRAWFARKRVWGIVAAAVMIYFCLVPSRTRISPETTGIIAPLTADGQVDYFAAYEKTYLDKLSPPEENGQRLLLAAFGPSILEQTYLAENVAWEDIPTHQNGKAWFENQWIPLCEHLYIDPYRKPMFYEKHGFYSYMDHYFQEQKKAAGEKVETYSNYEETQQLHEKLAAAPWKREDYPESGKWLDEYSEVLDYFGMCVRKPHFASWRWKPENGALFFILLPDIQANRDFARSLQVRIAERVGRGDIDGAWYDVMSMKHISRHYVNDSNFVANLVGASCNEMAQYSLKLIFAHCHLTEEQLVKFQQDLEQLPPFNPLALSLTLERYMIFQALQFLKQGKETTAIPLLKLGKETTAIPQKTLGLITKLPIDANIAGQRLTELYGELGLKGWENDKHLICNPTLRQKYFERLEQSAKQLTDKTHLKNQWYRILFIRSRSKLLAECLFGLFSPAVGGVGRAFDRYDAENEMLRIAIALERYQLAHGHYPETLDALVPKYLDLTPIDPATGRTTFVYKLREKPTENVTATENTAATENESATEIDPKKEIDLKNKSADEKSETPKPPELPYILYSLGPDRKDSGGVSYYKQWNKNGKRDSSAGEYDIVF